MEKVSPDARKNGCFLPLLLSPIHFPSLLNRSGRVPSLPLMYATPEALCLNGPYSRLLSTGRSTCSIGLATPSTLHRSGYAPAVSDPSRSSLADVRSTTRYATRVTTSVHHTIYRRPSVSLSPTACFRFSGSRSSVLGFIDGALTGHPYTTGRSYII